MENSPTIKILLVEDNPGDARLVNEMLAEERRRSLSSRFDLVHVGCLDDARSTVQNGDPFDIILLDLSLPDQNGLETVSLMHQAAPDMPIVVMSGTNDEVLAVKAVQTGAQDYLVKGHVESYGLVRALRYAIERKRIEMAEREQREIAEALRDIIAALNSTLNLDEVLDRILANVGRVVPHDTANIMLIKADRANVVGGRGYRERGLPTMVGEYFIIEEIPTLQQMYRHGQYIVIPTTKEDAAWVDTPETRWIHSYAGSPIRIRDKIVGFINLASRIPGFFTDTQAKRLQAFAEQTGIALNNAGLLEAERDQRLLAETLTEVTLALTSQVSYIDVLDEILRQVQRLVPFKAAHIMLLERNMLRIARWQGYEAFGDQAAFTDLVQSLQELEIDTLVVETKKPMVIADTHQDPRWVIFEETAWVRSNITAPLCLRDRVLGILRLDSDRVNGFTPEDTERLQPLANAAAIALENSQLLEAEAKRRQEAETLREATVALTSALDLNQVLDTILTQLEKVIPYKSASVLLLENDQLRVVAGRGFENLDEVLGYSYPAGEDILFGEMERSQWPIYLPDVQNDSRYLAWGHAEQIHGWMGVPLLVRGKVIGYLMLNGQQVAAYGEADAELAQVFASQAAVAIENAQLFEKTERALTQTDALYRTTRSLIAFENLPELLQIVVDGLIETLSVTHAILITLDIEAKELTHYVTGGSGPGHPPPATFDEVWEGAVGQIIRRKNPILAPKEVTFSDENATLQATRRKLNAGAMMATPLHYRNKILGAMVAFNPPEERDLTEQDLDLMVAIAGQTAVAIENVRLFEATKQHVADLEAIRQAGLSLTSSLELETVLEAILESANLLTNLQSARIYLYQNQKLIFGAALWVEGTEYEIPEPSPSDLTYTVAQHGEPIMVPNIREHPVYTDAYPERYGAIASLPLKIGSRVVGVMNIEYHRPHVLPDTELRMLELLADQAAIAIENARLFEQAQEEIAERKRAEAKLNEYREHLEDLVRERTAKLEQTMLEAADARDKIDAILQSVADGLIVTDPDHRVILANPAAETLLGIKLEEMWGREIGTGIKDNRLREMVRYALEKRSSGYEVDIQPKDVQDSRKKVLRARTALVEDDQGKPQGTVTIIQDVTRLREIDRLKSDLLTTTAHELRTPLTSILGFSEILLSRDLNAERQRHYLSMINEQSSHLAKIVTELVDLSRLEAGHGMDLKLEEVKLAALMEEVVVLCAEKAAGHIINLEGLTALPPIEGDPFRLTQVGQNLLTNAINYSPKGATITIRGKSKAENVEISLQDEGIGMTPEQQEHLFKPFYRANPSHTGISGSGLGLATSKLIIEQHGGEVWIESEPDVGTTVYFTLPLSQPIERIK